MQSLTPAEVTTAGSRLLERPLQLMRELTGGAHAVTVLASDGSESYVARGSPSATEPLH